MVINHNSEVGVSDLNNLSLKNTIQVSSELVKSNFILTE